MYGYAVVAYIAMAYIVMAYIVTAHIVVAYIGTAYMVMAYMVMAYIVLAYIAMAYIGGAARCRRHRRPPRREAVQQHLRGNTFFVVVTSEAGYFSLLSPLKQDTFRHHFIDCVLSIDTFRHRRRGETSLLLSGCSE